MLHVARAQHVNVAAVLNQLGSHVRRGRPFRLRGRSPES